MNARIFLAAALILGSTLAAPAQPKPNPAESKKNEKTEEKAAAEASEKKGKPTAEQSVTQHNVVIGGVTVNYTATAGTLILRNEKDEPRASVGYTAYTRRDVADLSRRPITFAYNGGPGSSSIWLHMGALGPRRIVTSDAAATLPAPYKVVDNAESPLDKTDLVLIDPVGTGFSLPVGEAKDKDFWGVDQDIEAVSQFIKQYVTENGRWNSPKYLLGESYGTTRSAGVVDYLQSRENMAFNGVILVSVALDIESLFPWSGNDRPYALFLPSFAACAWYHKVLPSPPASLDALLAETRAYALGPYSDALMKGDALSDAEEKTVAEKLHQYTGLSVDYIEKARLRITESQFSQELLREHHVTIGRLDARFTGVTFDLLGENAEYDPQSAAISAAFTAAFLDYLHKDLKFGDGKTYVVTSTKAFPAWDWKHKFGNGFFPQPVANTGVDMAHALGYNPNLRLLVLNGIYDMATPMLATEYMMSHLNLEKSLRDHVELKYYPAGHMMYINEPSLKSFKADVAAFIDRTEKR